MRVVISWLKEYVDLSGVSVEELAHRWTLAGLEVESIEHIGDWWDPERMLVGEVVRVKPHPNADRLVLADVDYGADSIHTVVTGAPNLMDLQDAGTLEQPLKVVFARAGAELYDGYQEGWVKTTLEPREVRGVMSDAMVCSAKEIGLSEEHEGILILSDDAPVGASLVDVLGDAVVELDLTPNYARAMSMVGVARETAAVLARPFSTPEPTIATVAGDIAALAAVEIEAPELCPRYTARIVRDIEVGPSPGWMRRRLTLAGMRPINNIVDVTNYVMLEWGEPLHAFDYDLLVERADGKPPTITVRRAREGERMTTLDDVERTLDPETLLITDEAGPLAIAGVMGGAETEVSNETRSVLIEAASFHFLNVRRTSRAQKLPSESASRFGRGVHPALVGPASTRSAELMRQLANGTVVEGWIDAYPRPPAPVVIALEPAEAERILGLEIPEETIVEILERLELDVRRENGALEATVPPHRMDLERPVDLIEEVARIHGYDRLPSTLLADSLPPQRDNPDLTLEARTRDALAATGLQEIISYRLVSIAHEADLVVDRDVERERYLTLLNPPSPRHASLRRSMLTGLLDAAERNLRYADRVALFELGHVYHAAADGDDATLPDEPRRVALLLTGPAAPRGWRNADPRPTDFYDARGAVEVLLEALGIEATWRPGEHPSMHPGRTAVVRLDDETLGHVGELHPMVRERWELGERTVAVADLDLDALGAVARDVRRFRTFSTYPAVRQDLAVVVDEDVPARAVADVIRDAAGSLLSELVLFDVYRGEQIGAGRKSLAWSLAFQAADKTLTSEAATAVRGRIVGALEDELDAELR